jgi:hypothetical protein
MAKKNLCLWVSIGAAILVGVAVLVTIWWCAPQEPHPTPGNSKSLGEFFQPSSQPGCPYSLGRICSKYDKGVATMALPTSSLPGVCQNPHRYRITATMDDGHFGLVNSAITCRNGQAYFDVPDQLLFYDDTPPITWQIIDNVQGKIICEKTSPPILTDDVCEPQFAIPF